MIHPWPLRPFGPPLLTNWGHLASAVSVSHYTRSMSAEKPISPLIGAERPKLSFKKSLTIAASSLTNPSESSPTYSSVAPTFCKVTPPKPKRHIWISSPSGKTPTPTSRSSSKPRPSTGSCSSAGHPILRIGPAKKPTKTTLRSGGSIALKKRKNGDKKFQKNAGKDLTEPTLLEITGNAFTRS